MPPSKLPSGEPVTVENLDYLCFNCPLPDCDEKSPECLIQIAKREDPKLVSAIRYRNWIENNRERRQAQQRAHYERTKEKRTAQQSERRRRLAHANGNGRRRAA
jgi:hypothetical protein